MEQWIDFAALEIDANIARWLYPRYGFVVYLPPVNERSLLLTCFLFCFCKFNDFFFKFCIQAEEAAIAALKRALGALNTYLASTTYLVGHSVTLADIVLTCNLAMGFGRILTKSFTSEFPHVERYFWTMVNQPNFSKIMGKVEQAESIPPLPSVKKPAQPKETAKPKPKDEPKKEAEKLKVEEAPEEEAPKPKAKNPLDALPPSKMILDEWKRLYSNTKTNFREVAVKGTHHIYLIFVLISASFIFCPLMSLIYPRYDYIVSLCFYFCFIFGGFILGSIFYFCWCHMYYSMASKKCESRTYIL